MGTTEQNTAPRLRAAIYARISLDRKEQAGVTRQLEDCRKLADLHDLDVAVELVDNSVSAYSGVERPAYTELLRHVARGDLDRVIVWNTDRLTRRTRDLLDYLELTKLAGVVTLAVNGNGIDPSSSDSKFLATVLGAVAEQESTHKAERIRRAFQQRAELGTPRRDGRRTFGYEQDGATIREDEAAWINRAADHILGGGSLKAIVKTMKAAGVKTSTGRDMSTTTIRDTLKTPYIAGLSSWNPADKNGRRLRKNRVIVGKGQWPAIIDEDKWHALQDVLSNPARKTNHRGNTPRHLLSAIAKCAVCGRPMYGRYRTYDNGQRIRYYYCKGETETGGTAKGHPNRVADSLDAYVTEVVLQRLEQVDILTALAEASDDDKGEVAQLKEQRDQLRGRVADLEEQVALGTIAPAQFGRINAKIADQLEAIEGALTRFAGGETNPLTLLKDVPNVREWWAESSTLEDRRRLIDAIVSVTIKKGKPGSKSFDPDAVDVVLKGAD